MPSIGAPELLLSVTWPLMVAPVGSTWLMVTSLPRPTFTPRRVTGP